MDLTLPEIQTQLVNLNRVIGRLERDVELYPRNKELLKPQLDAYYQTYGRLSYWYDEKSKHSQTSLLRRLLRKP